ncbi:unnamed protein product, partial [Laminaria digitata]
AIATSSAISTSSATVVDSPDTLAAKLVEMEHLLNELREMDKQAAGDRTGASSAGAAPATPSGVVTGAMSRTTSSAQSGTAPTTREMHVTRASTRGRPSTDDNTDDLQPSCVALGREDTTAGQPLDRTCGSRTRRPRASAVFHRLHLCCRQLKPHRALGGDEAGNRNLQSVPRRHQLAAERAVDR